MTHIYTVIYREPIPSPKIESRQPDSLAATGGTMNCHNDNPGCHQRQPSRQIDDPPSSEIVMYTGVIQYEGVILSWEFPL